MGRGSIWEGRVRLARRAEEADPQRSVTDKQRRQRALPSQTLRAAGLSGLDCVGSGGTDRRRSAPPLTALPNPEFPSRRTPPHFQTGSQAFALRAWGWFVCLQGSLQLGPAAAQGRRIGLAMERGPRDGPWVLDGMSRAELCRSGSPDRSGESVEYSRMNELYRAEAASAGTIFCWIGGAQIANNFKIWSSLRFKATDGEQAPDWIASETLGISTMRSAGW